jgi:hypothetical protein
MSAPESSSATSVATKNTEDNATVNKLGLSNEPVSDVKDLILKSGKTPEEKEQVVKLFIEACNISREDLTKIVEDLLDQVCEMALVPKPTSGMAERIINQRIYGSFDAYSPVPYPDMGEPFISLNQSQDFKDIFQNGLTEALISEAKSQLSTGPYEPKRPPEQAHYNVVDKTDSSKIIQIPDDGVCMFAAYLYADMLNKQDVNKS